MKIRSLLCPCGRGLFSFSDLMVVYNDPISFAPDHLKVAECLSCGQNYIADLRPKSQRLIPALSRKEVEAVVKEAKDAYLSQPAQDEPIVIPEGEQERAR